MNIRSRNKHHVNSTVVSNAHTECCQYQINLRTKELPIPRSGVSSHGFGRAGNFHVILGSGTLFGSPWTEPSLIRTAKPPKCLSKSGNVHLYYPPPSPLSADGPVDRALRMTNSLLVLVAAAHRRYESAIGSRRPNSARCLLSRRGQTPSFDAYYAKSDATRLPMTLTTFRVRYFRRITFISPETSLHAER